LLAVRNTRILVDDHVNMILVAAGIRQRDNPGHEIDGGVGTHAAHDASYFFSFFCH
jgi:hypothetical protein